MPHLLNRHHGPGVRVLGPGACGASGFGPRAWGALGGRALGYCRSLRLPDSWMLGASAVLVLNLSYEACLLVKGE